MIASNQIGILGRKVGITQIFDEKGACVPVTVVDTTGCTIIQVKTKENDGYSALQLGIGEKKPQNVNKAQAGHAKKAGVPAKPILKEMRVSSDEEINHLKAGKELKADLFAKGDFVDVTAVSIGKGFSGVMKRHNFHGTKASHGVHEVFRHGGSIGATTFPGRVFKNKKMPGQHGNAVATVQNLEVLDVKPKENLVIIKGSIPGPKSKVVFIHSAKKHPPPKKGFGGEAKADK